MLRESKFYEFLRLVLINLFRLFNGKNNKFDLVNLEFYIIFLCVFLSFNVFFYIFSL